MGDKPFFMVIGVTLGGVYSILFHHIPALLGFFCIDGQLLFIADFSIHKHYDLVANPLIDALGLVGCP